MYRNVQSSKEILFKAESEEIHCQACQEAMWVKVHKGPGSFYGVQEKWGGKEGGRKPKGIVWVALNFDRQTWIMIL